MICFKNFVNLSDDEILAVYRARTDERVADYCSAGKFSYETHLNFIKYLRSQNDKKYFMIYDDDKFIGVINFVNITEKSAEFGIYKNPSVDKVGKILMQEMINYAKFELNLSQITARVLEQNKFAIELYKKFGFEIVSEGKIYKMQKDLQC